MKLFYTLLFLIISYSVSAQDATLAEIDGQTEIPGFKLYPNPAFDDVIYITTKQNAFKEITIYDIFGKVVLHTKIANTSVNISELDAGVYVLQVIENKKRITRKLVVK